MRIIAGKYRGRRLESPKDEEVRPTPDRVKEGLFSSLGDFLEGAVVLDLFAGSGGLGLEALSRGAAKCYFVDNSADSIRLIRENVRLCRAHDQAVVSQMDYTRFLEGTKDRVDLIFLDPPYGESLWDHAVALLTQHGRLSDKAILVAEHPRTIEFPLDWHGLSKIKERRYGSVVLSFYMC